MPSKMELQVIEIVKEQDLYILVLKERVESLTHTVNQLTK